MKKKGDLILSTIILLISTILFLTITTSMMADDFPQAERKAQIEACKGAVAQSRFKPLGAFLKICQPIPLESPEKKEKTKQNTLADIAKYSAITWDIWSGSTVENILGGKDIIDPPFLPQEQRGKQPCFPQFTFVIVGKESIRKDEILDYLRTKAYPEFINPAVLTDQCSTKFNNGFWKDECDEDTERIETNIDEVQQPPGKVCCVSKENSCEANGGSCYAQTCPEDSVAYTGQPIKYGCNGKKCCIKKEHYKTYLDFIQKGDVAGAIEILPDFLYPQNYRTTGTKDLESYSGTYAIVFVARTTNFLSKGPDSNVNRILIAPLKDVKEQCVTEITFPE